MSEETIPVNIVIGDRNYRIRISPKDEETVRKTVKTINEKILEYKTSFAGQDMQDYIAMVLVWLATQMQAATPDWKEEEIGKKLAALEEMFPPVKPAADKL
jgi:cell division protein ZapA (FtsZ GTPase activity inhibitor)